MARTSLGPWKFVRDMGSYSHWELIMVPGQEANSDNLGKSFQFLHNNCMLSVLIRIASMRDSNEYTQHTISWLNDKFSLNICFLELSEEFEGTQKRVRISHGKRAIGIRAIEVLLYMISAWALLVCNNESFDCITVREKNFKLIIRELCMFCCYINLWHSYGLLLHILIWNISHGVQSFFFFNSGIHLPYTTEFLVFYAFWVIVR